MSQLIVDMEEQLANVSSDTCSIRRRSGRTGREKPCERSADRMALVR
jgi:hypothetical protein